jgi:hypothetical protein
MVSQAGGTACPLSQLMVVMTGIAWVLLAVLPVELLGWDVVAAARQCDQVRAAPHLRGLPLGPRCRDHTAAPPVRLQGQRRVRRAPRRPALAPAQLLNWVRQLHLSRMDAVTREALAPRVALGSDPQMVAAALALLAGVTGELASWAAEHGAARRSRAAAARPRGKPHGGPAPLPALRAPASARSAGRSEQSAGWRRGRARACACA